MSDVAFFVCLSVSLAFFVLSNIYLVIKSVSINKKIKTSGRLVSSHPTIVVLQGVTTSSDNYRAVLSPDAVAPPPSYNEVMISEPPPLFDSTIPPDQSGPTLPPPYVKERNT